MRKTVVLFYVVFLFCKIGISSNFAKLSNNLNSKIYYQQYPCMDEIVNPFLEKPTTSAFKVEMNYCFNRFFSSGFNLGFGKYEGVDLQSKVLENNGTSFVKKRMKPMLLYGVNINMQLLPIFIKKDDFFMDLYLSAKLGGIHLVDNNKGTFGEEHSNLDYGIYGGIAVHPFKQWGVFYEYGYGNYIKWRAGISLRL